MYHWTTTVAKAGISSAISHSAPGLPLAIQHLPSWATSLDGSWPKTQLQQHLVSMLNIQLRQRSENPVPAKLPVPYNAWTNILKNSNCLLQSPTYIYIYLYICNYINPQIKHWFTIPQELKTFRSDFKQSPIFQPAEVHEHVVDSIGKSSWWPQQIPVTDPPVALAVWRTVGGWIPPMFFST